MVSGANRALVASDQARAGLGPSGFDHGYEAMVYTANLPMQTITFVYQDGGPPMAGGIFQITRVRTVTDDDRKVFPLPPDGVCPCCGREEEY
jgi:hypothetical protein